MTAQPTITIEQILLEECPEVKEIRTDEKDWPVPDIDYTLFSNQPQARHKVEVIAEYLNAPYIILNIENGRERAWRKTLPQEFPIADVAAYYETNALRLNKMGNIKTSIQFLELIYQGTDQRVTEAFEKVNEFFQEVPNDGVYKHIPNEQKVDLAKDLKERAYNVLKALAADT